MTETLKRLHAQATDTRNEAHLAYTVALRNSQAKGDTEAAWQTLLLANAVRDNIYSVLLNVTAAG